MIEVHSANMTMIDGAIFEGRYEGRAVSRSAADWLRIFGHNPKASRAIRGARDGAETVFTGSVGEVWHLRPAPADTPGER